MKCAYELARYCNSVKTPQSNSVPGISQFMGNSGNKYAKGICPMT